MERSLTRQLRDKLLLGMLAILVCATPFLYYITTHYYAEDLMDLIVHYGIRNPDIDLERDVLAGVFIQLFVLLVFLLSAIALIMQILPHRLWQPFRQTLQKIKEFRVERGAIQLPVDTGISEFSQLNGILNNIMSDSVRSYQVQKEFTENASHELQTPLAILQNKIDNLLQDEHLTKHQAEEMQEMYQEVRHMSNLSRSLLMLSKIENRQYAATAPLNVCGKLTELLPRLESLTGNISLVADLRQTDLTVDCNETLFESMVNNLVVNAIRHNKPGGTIFLTVADGKFTVSNTSDEHELDASHLFSRFYRIRENQKGNGLGLAIVKSICDHQKWTIAYRYHDAQHSFIITF